MCINHDTSIMRDLICKMIDLEKIGDMGDILGNISFSQNDSSIETLSHSIEDILVQSVDSSYLNSDYQLSITQKKKLLKSYMKKVFLI